MSKGDVTADVAIAQRDEALDVIAKLLSFRKGIEYSDTPEQRTVRAAKALLAEHGRKVTP